MTSSMKDVRGRLHDGAEKDLLCADDERLVHALPKEHGVACKHFPGKLVEVGKGAKLGRSELAPHVFRRPSAAVREEGPHDERA